MATNTLVDAGMSGQWVGAFAPPAYSSRRVTLSDSQIRSLHSEPVEVVPAPGANKIVVPVFYWASLKYGGTAFSDNVEIKTYMAGFGAVGNSIIVSSGAETDASAQLEMVTSGSKFAGLISGGAVNGALSFTGPSDLTGGDGSELVIMVTYLIMDLTGLI